jgi:nicotinamidase-related amidase
MQTSTTTQSDTAVILVDMQDFFLKNFLPSAKKTLIENQLRVIDICVKKKIPFIILEYKCRGVFRGSLIGGLDKKIQNAHKEVIVKEHNSGFTKTKLHSILKELRVKKLLIMGVNANGCVQDTAIGARSRGFKVVTSCGVIGSASRGDLGLSKRNKDWYVCNTIFKNDTDDLVNYLHAS